MNLIFQKISVDGFGMKILQIMSDYNWECIVKNKFIIYQYRCS